MKIVGFGDSFIMDTPVQEQVYHQTYGRIVSDYFNTDVEMRGVAGSGPWNMFYDFINYKDHIDVALIQWSEICRLYHPKINPLNTAAVEDYKKEKDPYKEKVLSVTKDYYEYMYDHDQKNWEMKALMCMFDDLSTKYPNTKFIHLPGFSMYAEKYWWGTLYDQIGPHELEYYHSFKHGMEIHPAMMYLSKKDEWPNDIVKETRQCHLSLRMHKLMANAIITAIDNYTPGKVIDIQY